MDQNNLGANRGVWHGAVFGCTTPDGPGRCAPVPLQALDVLPRLSVTCRKFLIQYVFAGRCALIRPFLCAHVPLFLRRVWSHCDTPLEVKPKFQARCGENASDDVAPKCPVWDRPFCTGKRLVLLRPFAFTKYSFDLQAGS